MKRLPYVSGMRPGFGYDLVKGRILDTPFEALNLYADEGISGQTLDYNIQIVESQQDILEKLTFGASLSLANWDLLLQFNPTLNIVKEKKLSSNCIYLLASSLVYHPPELMNSFVLKPEADYYIKDQSLDLFHATYGHGFVAGRALGGMYLGLIEIETTTHQDKETLAGSLDSQLIMLAAGQFDSAKHLSSLFHGRQLRVHVYRTGGQSDVSVISLEDLFRDMASFPGSVAQHPSIAFYLYKDYQDIPVIQNLLSSMRKRHIDLTSCVDELKRLYEQYQACRDILMLILEPANASPLEITDANNIICKSALANDVLQIAKQLTAIEDLIASCVQAEAIQELPSDLYQLSPESSNVIAIYKARERQSNSAHLEQSNVNNKQALELPEHMRSNDAQYNIAIVGMSGVGKSSLINYLFGTETAKAGIGRPVTEKGFFRSTKSIQNVSVCFFDSWGLEVGKIDEWLQSLDDELRQRGTDKPVQEWFHTILYCIGAGRSRIEDSDISIIKKFTDSKYRVIAVLTKADMLTESEEALFIQTIKEYTNNIDVIPVCSEYREYRNGFKIEPYGKEAIEESIINNFWDSIGSRLPNRCTKLVEEYLISWKSRQIDAIRSCRNATSSIDISDLKTTIENSWDQDVVSGIISETIRETLSQYLLIANSLLTIDGDSIVADYKLDQLQVEMSFLPNWSGRLGAGAAVIGLVALASVGIAMTGGGAAAPLVIGAGRGIHAIIKGTEWNSGYSINKEKTLKQLESQLDKHVEKVQRSLPIVESRISIFLADFRSSSADTHLF